MAGNYEVRLRVPVAVARSQTRPGWGGRLSALCEAGVFMLFTGQHQTAPCKVILM